MKRPYGWSDQYTIDYLLKQMEQMQQRVNSLEVELSVLKSQKPRGRPRKPIAQGNLRVSGVNDERTT